MSTINFLTVSRFAIGLSLVTQPNEFPLDRQELSTLAKRPNNSVQVD